MFNLDTLWLNHHCISEWLCESYYCFVLQFPHWKYRGNSYFVIVKIRDSVFKVPNTGYFFEPLSGGAGKNTGVGCPSLLQEIFLTQGLNPGLPHCRQTLYCLSHQVSPLSKGLPNCQSGCPTFHSLKQWMRVSIALHPHWQLELLVFWISAMLRCVSGISLFWFTTP